MNDFRARFTKWYYRRGYRMKYRPDMELIFLCPVWIRPIVYFFFSPCAYYREYGIDLAEGFLEGYGGVY